MTKLINLKRLILLFSISAASAYGSPDSRTLLRGAEQIKSDAISLMIQLNHSKKESDIEVLPILASAILALEQTIDKAEEADLYLANHEDDKFLFEFTRACSKIAIARARLYRAKLAVDKNPSGMLMAEDFEELREDIVELRDEVDCPS